MLISSCQQKNTADFEIEPLANRTIKSCNCSKIRVIPSPNFPENSQIKKVSFYNLEQLVCKNAENRSEDQCGQEVGGLEFLYLQKPEAYHQKKDSAFGRKLGYAHGT